MWSLDGLVFDPAQITKRTANGVAVPHGDHFHFIPYSQMSALEEKWARNLPIGGQPVQSHTDNPKPSSTDKPSSTRLNQTLISIRQHRIEELEELIQQMMGMSLVRQM